VLPHAITVTSSEALGHLREMLDEAQRRAVYGIMLFVPHNRIAEAARHLGWQQVIVTESGDDGMMSGLVAWANTKRK
jgi:uroporphyrinogen-III synthase